MHHRVSRLCVGIARTRNIYNDVKKISTRRSLSVSSSSTLTFENLHVGENLKMVNFMTMYHSCIFKCFHDQNTPSGMKYQTRKSPNSQNVFLFLFLLLQMGWFKSTWLWFLHEAVAGVHQPIVFCNFQLFSWSTLRMLWSLTFGMPLHLRAQNGHVKTNILCFHCRAHYQHVASFLRSLNQWPWFWDR